jgi:hypothetical protein
MNFQINALENKIYSGERIRYSCISELYLHNARFDLKNRIAARLGLIHVEKSE